MKTADPADPATALLLLDVHRDVLGRLAPEREADVRASMTRALGVARQAKLLIIYVMPLYRPGYPELGPFMPSVRDQGLFADVDAAAALPPEFERRPHEPLVAKFAYSPFLGTDLELILRRRRIGKVVLAGVSTSGVVLSTLRDAYDRDFELVVLADACADFDADIHQMLLGRLFPRQAQVIDTADMAGAL